MINVFYDLLFYFFPFFLDTYSLYPDLISVYDQKDTYKILNVFYNSSSCPFFLDITFNLQLNGLNLPDTHTFSKFHAIPLTERTYRDPNFAVRSYHRAFAAGFNPYILKYDVSSNLGSYT